MDLLSSDSDSDDASNNIRGPLGSHTAINVLNGIYIYIYIMYKYVQI